jgi:GntR family transcriptional regulator
VDATQAPDARGPHKYQAVRGYLLGLVERELDVGDAIESERALCERFGVSRMTVRQAVDALVGEGILVREQGRGTFVAPRRMDFEMRLTTFGEEMVRRGMRPDTKVLDAQQVPAPRDAAEALGIGVGEPVHHLLRVRYADGAPMSIEELWVPVALAPDLFRAGPPDSLYDALRAHGLAPEWGEDTLTAADATDTEQQLLALRGSRAVLRAERRTFSADGAVVFSRACYRGDRYSVWVPLRAPGPTLVPRGGAVLTGGAPAGETPPGTTRTGAASAGTRPTGAVPPGAPGIGRDRGTRATAR